MTVSVIIPCFNDGHHVRRAVQSVVEQAVGAEIIVVDDKSTDSSLALIRQLEDEFPGLRTFQLLENRGAAAARNFGLAKSSGEYVAFLDADDRYGPGVLKAASAALDRLSWISAYSFDVQLVDCHRTDVAPRHVDALAAALPANLVVRRAAAALIGPFPEDAVFRAPEGGEDIAYRNMLRRFFPSVEDRTVALLHTVKRGSYFDKFMDSANRFEAGESMPVHHEKLAAHQRFALRLLDRLVDLSTYPHNKLALDRPSTGQKQDFFTYTTTEAVDLAIHVLKGMAHPRPPIDAGDVRRVLDLGAHIGASAYRLGVVFPNAALYALEPDPIAYGFLIRNTANHGSIAAYNFGLTAGSTTAPIDRPQLIDADEFFRAIGNFDVISMSSAVDGLAICATAPDNIGQARVLYIDSRSEVERRSITDLLSSSHRLERVSGNTLMYIHKFSLRSVSVARCG